MARAIGAAAAASAPSRATLTPMRVSGRCEGIAGRYSEKAEGRRPSSRSKAAPLPLILLLPLLSLLSAAIVLRMIRIGVLDHPGARSSHVRPTPKGGGLGNGVATLVMLLAAGGRGLLPLGLAGLGIAVVSWFDDLRDFPFLVKLAAQLVAAAIATAGGLLGTAPTLPIFGVVPLGWLGWPLTMLWLVAATNAVNFMDGLNGLAAGVVGLAALVVGCISLADATPAGLVSLALTAGIAGFLPFNYPQARIFMGDVGSQFCGFMLAGLGLAASHASPTIPILLVPMLLVGLLFAVVFTLVRRVMARDRLTEAHRSHLYQIAHRSGLPAWLITLAEWSFVLSGAVAAALLEQREPASAAAAIAALGLPQAIWLVVVVRRARRVRLGRW